MYPSGNRTLGEINIDTGCLLIDRVLYEREEISHHLSGELERVKNPELPLLDMPHQKGFENQIIEVINDGLTFPDVPW